MTTKYAPDILGPVEDGFYCACGWVGPAAELESRGETGVCPNCFRAPIESSIVTRIVDANRSLGIQLPAAQADRLLVVLESVEEAALQLGTDEKTALEFGQRILNRMLLEQLGGQDVMPHIIDRIRATPAMFQAVSAEMIAEGFSLPVNTGIGEA